jgi:uncharacterized protein (TIGR00251 family)
VPVGDPVEATDDGVVLNVHVQPGASRAAVAGRHGDALKLKVTAPPVEGKANAAVLDLVAATLGVRVNQVELVGGASSRSKRVKVTGSTAEEARRLLSTLGAL